MRLKKVAVIPYELNLFCKHGNLKDMILLHRMTNLDDIMLENIDHNSIPGGTDKEKQAFLQQKREEIEKETRIEIDDYLPILFNQALVMLCTVFDVFLFDSLKVITQIQPNLLKMLANEKDLSISDVIDLADYQKIFEAIQSRILRRFDYKSIKEKLDALRKMGVDVNCALGFGFHGEQIRRRYPDGGNYLADAYDKRHNIVHRDQVLFRTYEELEDVAEFFDALLLSFGIVLGRHFNIQTDWELMLSGDRTFLDD